MKLSNHNYSIRIISDILHIYTITRNEKYTIYKTKLNNRKLRG